jgi:signal transduction histidine kinase
MTSAMLGGPSRWRVLGPFAAAMIVLLGLSIGGYQMLSAVRAFVGGESLWSKARSSAVAQLRVFADTGAAQAYARFNAALEVPLGDRQGREALDRRPADFAQARAGFLRGGNHPDDVSGMVWLYHAFSDTALMRAALGAWVEGDRLIEELMVIGSDLQQALAQRRVLAAGERDALHARLDAIDSQLVEVEKRFSASIGLASRRAVQLLVIANLGFAAAMSAAVLAYAGHVLRHAEHSRRQLAEANQRWALASASVGMGLFEWPAGGDSLILDGRAAALFGVQGEPDGRALRFDELRPQLQTEGLQAISDALGHALAAGTLLKLRLQVPRAEGSLRHVEARGIVQNEGSGRAARIVGLLRDVSDEVLRVELSAGKAAAEQVARARIEFLSRLSHELRTPLNAVLGFSQLLQMDGSLPSDAVTKVAHIEKAGEHLLRLVDDVLNITGINSGQASVTMAPVAVQPVLDAALLLVESQRAAMAVTIVDRPPATQAIVQADAQRLKQVFVNLLSNGCKYNRRGGRLTLSQRVDRNHLMLAFEDEGEGLDAAEIAALFQPFHRLHRHRAIEGTGLGHVIVKTLLAQMGGDIAVSSRPGLGSTFTVRLALAGTA